MFWRWRLKFLYFLSLFQSFIIGLCDSHFAGSPQQPIPYHWLAHTYLRRICEVREDFSVLFLSGWQLILPKLWGQHWIVNAEWEYLGRASTHLKLNYFDGIKMVLGATWLFAHSLFQNLAHEVIDFNYILLIIHNKIIFQIIFPTNPSVGSSTFCSIAKGIPVLWS